ncbi:hypothetical protein FQR65_LT16761 [Abscondita terminalis]|nr:hypothetical protein FQR65_LT16761 [Abscondita terminalis]
MTVLEENGMAIIEIKYNVRIRYVVANAPAHVTYADETEAELYKGESLLKQSDKNHHNGETNTSQFTNSLEEDEELGTVDELHSPEGQSGNTVPKTPSSDKPPAIKWTI